jgi:hypothetical protein
MSETNFNFFEHEARAVDLVARMEEFATQVLQSGSDRILPPKEEAQLRLGLANLRPTFFHLATQILDPLRDADPALTSYGFEQLWELMRATFLIGAHGAVTESAAEFFRPRTVLETRQSTAADARKAQTKKAAREEAKLLEAVKAVAKHHNLRLSSGTEFAVSIVDDVRERLKDSVEYVARNNENRRWPNINAIRTAVRNYKKRVGG